MSDTVQRWGTVPSEAATAKWALRSAPGRWGRGDEDRVRAFMVRQMDAALETWLRNRAAQYQAAFAGWSAGEAGREAMLDLFCWQRRQGKPAEALAWLREWERGFEAAGSMKRGAGRRAHV
jgi:hypothetical protein